VEILVLFFKDRKYILLCGVPSEIDVKRCNKILQFGAGHGKVATANCEEGN